MPDLLFPLTLIGLLLFLIAYFTFVKPFIEGMRDAERAIERQEYRFPEHCPMCGETTRMTRELHCAHCGEDMSPPGEVNSQS